MHVPTEKNKYKVPYHWFVDRATTKGRLYFGYLDWCKQFAKGRVLDVGCGEGRFLNELSGDVHGIDTDERGIAFAKLLSRGTFTVVDGKRIPYGDKSFDTIFLIETLEHIEPSQISTTIKEIHRTLKDDGKFIITVPSTRVPTEKKHYQHFTPESLQEAILPYFSAEIVGQNKEGFHVLKVLYKLLDNKLWLIRPLAKWYNINVWHKVFNVCKAKDGRRLMAACSKK